MKKIKKITEFLLHKPGGHIGVDITVFREANRFLAAYNIVWEPGHTCFSNPTYKKRKTFLTEKEAVEDARQRAKATILSEPLIKNRRLRGYARPPASQADLFD